MGVLPFARFALSAVLLTLAVAVLLPQIAQAQGYTESTLYSFTGTQSPADGANPQAALTLDGSGNLYGTTANGGANNRGTVFKIAAGSAAPTILYSFTSTSPDGVNPVGDLARDDQGNLYGTTANGGANGQGAIFKIAAGTNAETTLHSFTGTNTGGNPDGAQPSAGLVRDAQGNLYGTTFGGTTSDRGTVFRIASGSTMPETLHSFSALTGSPATNADGANPQAGLMLDSLGNLYGTTANGGTSGKGVVFEIATATIGTFATLHSFTGTDGANPAGDLVRDSLGNFYGTTFGGGAHGKGVVFEIASGSTTPTTLYSFTGAGTDGANPYAGLVRDAQGNLYGTTAYGGAGGHGTVFEIAAGTNAETVLYSFSGMGTDGATPFAGLVRDAQGNLYGTTYYGGTSSQGTVFELSPAPIAHTYVSNTGVDAGSCSRNAPCATFAYALTKTLPGGTITALNAGEYGPVLITQAVTVDGEGTQAGITVASGNAIAVNAGPTDVVLLRHLTLSGGGGLSSAGTNNENGIEFTAGGPLTIEDCHVEGFNSDCVDLLGTGPVTVTHSTFGNASQGLFIGTGTTGPARVSLNGIVVQHTSIGVDVVHGAVDLSHSLIAQNILAGSFSPYIGLLAEGGTISVSDCTLTGNGIAVQSVGSGSIVRLTNNDIDNNGTALDSNNNSGSPSTAGTIASSGNNRRAGNATATTPLAPTDQPNRSIAVQ